ncbi:MAG: hypothetical protein FWE36_06265 [Erysipelotrichales bacterium]|nr:hypothetical protein [Erysipelotrichales bacterium]
MLIGDVYGGAISANIMKNTELEIIGLVNGNIYGGSLNNILGNPLNSSSTKITIKGQANDCYGGGKADRINSRADVHGSTSIIIYGITSDIFGGGYAQGIGSSSDVYGNTNITINNKKKLQIKGAVYHGGKALDQSRAQVINVLSDINYISINVKEHDFEIKDGISDAGDIRIFGNKQILKRDETI